MTTVCLMATPGMIQAWIWDKYWLISQTSARPSRWCGGMIPGYFLGFSLPQVPFLGFLSHSDRTPTSFILLGWSICPLQFPDFNLEGFLFKIYLLWKIWPISVKRWKSVSIPACDLQYCCIWGTEIAFKMKKQKGNIVHGQKPFYVTIEFYMSLD